MWVHTAGRGSHCVLLHSRCAALNLHTRSQNTSTHSKSNTLTMFPLSFWKTKILNGEYVGASAFSMQVLQMFKDYVDPDFTWSNFSIEEQAKVIVAPRSNNLLDTARVSPKSGQWNQLIRCSALHNINHPPVPATDRVST